MSKHTPGPWKQEIGHYHFILDDEGHAVGTVSPRIGIGGLPVAKANARLIAAAPDMLDLLQRAEKNNGLSGVFAPMARDLIHKTIGVRP